MRRSGSRVSATSTGFGIWATHFIAMLAFSPGIPNAYNIALTFLSLIAAILLTGAGLAVALQPEGRRRRLARRRHRRRRHRGDALYRHGRVRDSGPHRLGSRCWSSSSIVLGGVIGAVALPVGLHGASMKWKILGALLLTLAICSHHFTAMAAASIIPDPTIVVSADALPAGWLAIAVALASFIIIVLALAGVAIEMRDRRRGELETDRMRGLANAAVEGLLVCDGEKIVTVNDSFAALVGTPADSWSAPRSHNAFPTKARGRSCLAGTVPPIEGELLQGRRLDDAGRADSAPGRFRRQDRTTPSRCATCRRARRPSSTSAFSPITMR